ncbi:MAG: lytic transglycosylase domain-containing protein [Candidatus Aminicenantales bacterium]
MSRRKLVLFIPIFSLAILFLFPLTLLCGTKEKNVQSRKYRVLIQSIARRHGIPPSLVESIILVESNFNHLAISPKGAQGLMQLMPATARKYGVKDIFDPVENIEGGVKYLKELIKTYKSHTNLVLAAYNAGKEAVEKYNGIPPFKETVNFIRKVRKYFNKSSIPGYSNQIYKFYNSEGKLVLTNNPRLRAINSNLPRD